LTETANYYVQKTLYEIPTFVKALDQSLIAQQILDNTTKSRYVIEGDFSSYDSSQQRWCAEIENYIVKLASKVQPIIGVLWNAIVNQPMRLKTKAFDIMCSYARASGEKSTSWGNTYLTHMFVQFALALYLAENSNNNSLEHWLNVAINERDLTPYVSGGKNSKDEGDDNIIPCNDLKLTEYLDKAASMLGFSLT